MTLVCGEGFRLFCVRLWFFFICHVLPTSLSVTRCDQKESTHAAVGPSRKQHLQRKVATVRKCVRGQNWLLIFVSEMMRDFKTMSSKGWVTPDIVLPPPAVAPVQHLL